MRARYLEVTFRRGRAFAAYLYLPREPGAKSERTERLSAGLLVDYAAGGQPIGIEITAPTKVTLEQVNDALGKLGLESLDASELAPLRAA